VFARGDKTGRRVGHGRGKFAAYFEKILPNFTLFVGGTALKRAMTNPDHWHNLRESIQSAWPVSRYRDVGVVVGCSGGADSVALLRCLVELARGDSNGPAPAGFIVAAHFNHRLRGEASDGDADFVGQLADDLGLPFEIQCGDGARRDEATARDQRREFFGDVMRRRGARYLALGHSLDDNVETVLHRLMRGTGPAGLAGISPFRALTDDPSGSDFVVARPMLAVGRRHIRDALRECGHRWREDLSNRSTEYQRNWIRSELVPMIQTQFPNAVPAIARAIDGQRQWSETIGTCVDRWLDIHLVQSDPLILRRLDQMDRDVDSSGRATLMAGQAVSIEALRRCWHRSGWPLQAMGRPQWNRVFELLRGNGPDSMTLPGSIIVRRDEQSITIARQR
jgi:tRNA(Ile)-lysidine synthase